MHESRSAASSTRRRTAVGEPPQRPAPQVAAKWACRRLRVALAGRAVAATWHHSARPIVACDSAEPLPWGNP